MSRRLTPHKKQLLALRAHKARMRLQQLRTVEREGVVYTETGQTLDRAGVLADMLRAVSYRLARHDGGLNRGDAYERAMDIIRHGERSRWWFARTSFTEGTGKRSIGAALSAIGRRKARAEARAARG